MKLYKAEMGGCFVFTVVMWSVSRKLLINKSNYKKPANESYKHSFWVVKRMPHTDARKKSDATSYLEAVY